MSIAMGRMEPSSGFGGGGVGVGVDCGSVFEAPAIGKGREEGEEEEVDNRCSSSATSSIGRNSGLSERSTTDGDDGDDNEVQSAYNGPLDMMNSLEEVLPIRRGISSFYNGKSKSFTSLAEASSISSVKDIAKQENAYNRRRRNLLAINHVWDKDKNRSSPHRSNGNGISKRPLSSSKSTLALAVALSSSESLSSASDDSNSNSISTPLPPLHPRSRPSPWRSYSVADLQQCRTEATTTNAACSRNSDETEHEKLTRLL